MRSIAALLFVATLVAAWVLLSRSGVSKFYEVYFSPAVNFACTGQFAELDVRTPRLKELAAFLDRKADTFDCAALPRDLAGYVRAMDVVQEATIYLIGVAALIWRWAGVCVGCARAARRSAHGHVRACRLRDVAALC